MGATFFIVKNKFRLDANEEGLFLLGPQFLNENNEIIGIAGVDYQADSICEHMDYVTAFLIRSE